MLSGFVVVAANLRDLAELEFTGPVFGIEGELGFELRSGLVEKLGTVALKEKRAAETVMQVHGFGIKVESFAIFSGGVGRWS